MKSLFLTLLLFAAALFAAEPFWSAKPFTAWSDAEVHQLMTNSPWAREVAVSDMSVGPPEPVGSVGGRRAGHGATFSGTSPAGVTTSGAKIRAVVFWESALPARQALARVKFGAEAGESKEGRDFIGQEGSSYVVLITGIPAGLVREDLAKISDGLAAKTSLTVKGRSPLQPSKAEVFADGQAIGMYFEFPRSFGITLQDKEVNFSIRLADLDVKSIFHPADMVFGGKLEL
jgi:hypothetical protein